MGMGNMDAAAEVATAFMDDLGGGMVLATLLLIVVGGVWVRDAWREEADDQGLRALMMTSRHSSLILPPAAARDLQLRAKKMRRGRGRSVVDSFNTLVDTLHIRRTTSSLSNALSDAGSGTLSPPTAYLASDEEQRSSSPFDKVEVPPGCRPLIAFVNSKSGGGQGAVLLRSLKSLLNNYQVFDLAKGNPKKALAGFKALERFNVLVCGGDGTVGWILSAMDELGIPDVPVSIMPLGTGNDLARVLDWGGGYEGENVEEILAQIASGHIRGLDRWKFEISSGKAYNPTARWTNYISVGVDAEVALRFHEHRNELPKLHFARMVNKIWYFRHGVVQFLTQVYRKVFSKVEAIADATGEDPNKICKTVSLICDGTPLELPPDTAGVIVSNIGSYGGGASGLWPGPEEIDMHDEKLEVVAVTGVLHLTQIQLGLSSGINLGQYSTVAINTKKEMKMQIDGEPWRQPPCSISITHAGAVNMLCRTVDNSGASLKTLTDLLEWAEGERHVSHSQTKVLLAELRRRCNQQRAETKMRKSPSVLKLGSR
eukprot:TRINITY_DN20414_c0_g1_i1.p1 TRINITY_DN20414_c0_g1~~TRINITY_DN20414_c0_g1_i1.p1  ORF type:complete len:542 (+),score=180.57 TRINITY_DN20414_c0_g1_i1:38-1663(+)